MRPALACPRCKRALREVNYHGTRIDVCDCGGIWFDEGELAEWVRKGKSKHAVPDGNNGASLPADPLRCPRCAKSSLRSRVLDGAPFARCDTCAGIWLAPEGVARMSPAYKREAYGVADVLGTVLEALLTGLWFV